MQILYLSLRSISNSKTSPNFYVLTPLIETNAKASFLK